MKLFLTVLFAFFPFTSLLAQEPPSSGDRVILIEEKEVRPVEKSSVFVESGSDVIMGEPVENLQGAYRKWMEACETWKKELKSLNSGNLMIASCGPAVRKEEKVQLTTFYSFSSKATYKIKVGCE